MSIPLYAFTSIQSRLGCVDSECFDFSGENCRCGQTFRTLFGCEPPLGAPRSGREAAEDTSNNASETG